MVDPKWVELRLGWPTWNYSADNYVLSFRSLGENVCFVSMGYVSDSVPEVARQPCREAAMSNGTAQVKEHTRALAGFSLDGD